MARVYLQKTSTGFVPADEESRELWQRYKLGDAYRAEIVKPRSYQHHKLAMSLLSLTYENLPERYAQSYANPKQFRRAMAKKIGHVECYVSLDGTIEEMPLTLSYDDVPDDVNFGKLFAAMMTECAKILGLDEPSLAEEVSRYADEHYGVAA